MPSARQSIQDQESVAAAFTRLRAQLLAYLVPRLAEPEQAQDLLQGVFLKALEAHHAGGQIHNLGGWLYTASRRALADHYRTSGKPTEPLHDDLAATEDDALLSHQALASCLRPMIEQLPPAYRDTLIATQLQGIPMATLAQQQGVSVSAIKSRTARARQMLKQQLLQCCEIEIARGGVVDFTRRLDARSGAAPKFQALPSGTKTQA